MAFGDDSWPLVLLGLRIGVAALLYLFLLAGFNTLRRELAARGRPASPMPVTASMSAFDRLEVTDSAFSRDLVGRSYPLDGLAIVGRDPQSEIVLGDRHVSARHARLQRREGGWWIEDLGSTNGTFVGDRRVDGAQPLSAEAPIRFGSVTARLVRGSSR